VLNDILQMERYIEGPIGQRLVTVRLTEIFRQAHSSLIVTGAHDILRGEMPKTGRKGENADLFLIEREEPEACITVVKELVAERIPARFGLDALEDIQVLAPMHKGILGVANLNEQLQELLNPEALERHSIISGGSRFRVGDKVMQQRNNYDLEVFNGDIGRVAALDPELDWIDISFPERIARYPVSELSQLTLAYACSVHKSQGSEYPVVIIPVHTQHFVMLQRYLLYTAITRGKKLVVLVGTQRALQIAIRNDKQTYRASRLIRRVTAKLQ
jgi:exodeoxyribonuclease V alpha subunit